MPSLPPQATTLEVHASAYPAAQRQALLSALRQRALPGWWLYGSAAQAQRWLDYHQAWSPSRGSADLQGQYRAAFAQVTADLAAAGSSAPHLVSLGCGGGHKDAWCLEALRTACAHDAPHYTPLDASAALVLEAALHVGAAQPATRQHPLVADLSAWPDLSPWLEGHDRGTAPRLFTAFGMLPNFPPAAFLGYLAGLLRPQDRLLLSANLSPGGLATDGPRILAQYDNAPARAWYGGALEELGLPASAAPLAVTPQMLPNAPGAWQVHVGRMLREPVTLRLHGEAIDYAAGEALTVFFSNRYSVPGAQALLAAQGLQVQATWADGAEEEAVFLCARG